jgi:hypothetical protein
MFGAFVANARHLSRTRESHTSAPWAVAATFPPLCIKVVGVLILFLAGATTTINFIFGPDPAFIRRDHMESTLAVPLTTGFGKRHEFLVFSIIVFLAKSYLLVRMPYRPAWSNAAMTIAILGFFYCYLRFRQSIRMPWFLLVFLMLAVSEDVAGNFFGLYGTKVGPFMFDEVTHFFGSGLALPPTMWLLRTTTRRMQVFIPAPLLSFLSVTIAFAFSAYYEVLELWDEKFWGGKRLWTPTDSANDLQFGLLAIVLFAVISHFVFKLIDHRRAAAVARTL